MKVSNSISESLTHAAWKMDYKTNEDDDDDDETCSTISHTSPSIASVTRARTTTLDVRLVRIVIQILRLNLL